MTQSLILDDCRRLTGKNLLSDKPGAVIDVFIDGYSQSAVKQAWQCHVQSLLDSVNWHNEKTFVRQFSGGLTLAISAPMDALYAACELIEHAWNFAVADVSGQRPEKSAKDVIIELKQLISEEIQPELLTLIRLAEKHNVAWLADDDEFSLGYGQTVQVWPIDNLPDAKSINWSGYKTIPVAYITGTNGKSTCVRLASNIIKHANLCAGVTSTDFIRVGEDIIDTGDYSGPGGARMLLRNNKTELGLLEVARGGLLRRGLPIPQVDVALMTNIANDHLGQYGINTLADLAQAKGIVAKGVKQGGYIVLNADDAELVEFSKQLTTNICWFSLSPDNPQIERHISEDKPVCYLLNDELIYHHRASDKNPSAQVIANVNDIPMCFGGAAKHNVQNVLAVIALCKGLSIGVGAITAGLTSFRSDANDNPGRGNVFSTNGAKIIVDFAHNEHSMLAMADTLKNIGGNRKFLLMSSAGDRSNEEIMALTDAALTMAPDVLVIHELEHYLRGRELGEVPDIIKQRALEKGILADNIIITENAEQGATYVKDNVSDGDLALLFVLSGREQVFQLFS
ncbi:Mur ligase family protein [Thalassotalea crassostreae]|uniref:Mur ligase family protein n=1 Tax=Thalassotalea crassostreae TaxID=1763536 RepID=UPI0008399903|nr:Mur ligase family protein [Thalassotalea crassostreae]